MNVCIQNTYTHTVPLDVVSKRGAAHSSAFHSHAHDLGFRIKRSKKVGLSNFFFYFGRFSVFSGLNTLRRNNRLKTWCHKKIISEYRFPGNKNLCSAILARALGAKNHSSECLASPQMIPMRGVLQVSFLTLKLLWSLIHNHMIRVPAGRNCRERPESAPGSYDHG
jgi:hypothetical protein